MPELKCPMDCPKATRFTDTFWKDERWRCEAHAQKCIYILSKNPVCDMEVYQICQRTELKQEVAHAK